MNQNSESSLILFIDFFFSRKFHLHKNKDVFAKFFNVAFIIFLLFLNYYKDDKKIRNYREFKFQVLKFKALHSSHNNY